jgi:hypothetical protein
MRKILGFRDFVNEQVTTPGATGAPDSTGEKPKAGATGGAPAGNDLGTGILGGILNKLLGEIDPSVALLIDQTKEVKESLPYTSCGSPYTFQPVTAKNQDIMNIFTTGKFKDDARYQKIRDKINSKSNEIFLVGIREKIEVKKKEGDKFIDKIAVIDPTKPNEVPASYQITTSPSVVYYGDPNRVLNKDGVAIMDPGVVEYKIGMHNAGSPSAHEALIQASESEIQRFKVNTKEIDTYNPDDSNKIKGIYGLNIHRSSKVRGACVAAYSAGCQVFADGTDFDKFLSTMKSSQGATKLYVLIENDELTSGGSALAAGGNNDEEKDDNETSTKAATKAAVKGGASDASIQDLADLIKKEKKAFNSDEAAVIKKYNQVIKSDADWSSLFVAYGDTLWSDLDSFLSNSEFKELNFRDKSATV